MKKEIKRGGLWIGACAVTFASMLLLVIQPVQGSKVKVTSNKVLTTKVSKRNVEPTGKAGLYTKPSALKGDKLVLSRKTMKKMDHSENANHYLRAYRVAKTNQNQVYYKVVSFDGKHRGWVYGGQKTNRFSGGLHAVKTYRELALTAEEKTATYQFTNPGTRHVTWRAPYGTTYKPTKVVKSLAPYANDTLTVKSVVEREKGDEIYYYIASQEHPGINGWIQGKAVEPAFDTSSNQPGSTLPEQSASGQKPTAPTSTPSPDTSSPEKPGGTLNYSGTFSSTDAKVYKNAFSQETDQSVISKVQKSYKEQVIKGLSEPFNYDQNMSLVEIATKLGHGKRFTAEGGRNYAVIVNPTGSSLVTLIPYSQIKWINAKAAVSGLDSGILGMLINDELKAQIQSAANLYYKVNYLGSLVIMSPMSDSTVKRLLGDGKQLSINVEQFFEELPITVKFDIGVKIDRDDNGITAVNVDLKLDPESLKVPDPENPVKCQLNVDVKQLGLGTFPSIAAQAAIRVFYPIRYPYYNKIDQSMSPDKIKRVLGHGQTIQVNQSGIKANLTMAVDVSQENGVSKNVTVKVVATKLTE
ncbi:hypothetical protein [Lentilactobacillus hilgardii]|uniref:hypothetical protein n=1 Tax=Lentilactobacillus hilgardii TaxID=1588 RepID=UPI003FA5FA47